MILLVLVFMFDSITGLLAYVYQDQVDIDLNQHLVGSFVQVNISDLFGLKRALRKDQSFTNGFHDMNIFWYKIIPNDTLSDTENLPYMEHWT